MTSRWLMLLATLAACRGGIDAPRSTEKGPAHPGWQTIQIDYPIFYWHADASVERGATVGFELRAPSGAALYEHTAYIELPGDHIVMLAPDEDWAKEPRPAADHVFVNPECTRRRSEYGEPLEPWPARPVAVEGAEGVTVCVGPGAEGEQHECYVVSSYMPAARTECGGGASCLDESVARLIAEICASVRRR